MHSFLLDGSTPLMLAAQKGSLEMVQWILDHATNINYRDSQQRNCIFYALLSNVDNSDVVRALLEKGAKADQESLDGFIPIMKACEQGLVNSLKVLLEHNADPNIVRPSTGDTALHLVARNKKPSAVKCAKILLEAGGAGNIANKNKKTPLHEALENNKKVYKIIKKHMEANEQAAYEAEQELVKDAHESKTVNVSNEILKFTAANNASKKHMKQNSRESRVTSEVAVKNAVCKEDGSKDTYRPIMGTVNSNKALSFANEFTEIGIKPKIDFDESQIQALKSEGKKKDKVVASLQEKNNVLRTKIQEKRDRMTILLKKIEQGKGILNPIHTKHEKSPTTYELMQQLPLPNIKYRDDLYKVLNGEIERFCHSVKCIKESEQPARAICITEIKKILAEIDPDLKLVTYGSYATDLWLPLSAIDLMITGNQDQPLLEKLRDMVKKETWCTAVSFIAQKSILKVECKIKNLAVCIHLTLQDIRHKGLEFAELIKEYTKSLPFFGELGLLLKYLFRIADLNDSYKVILECDSRKV
jgi:ankyrin repeat protein